MPPILKKRPRGHNLLEMMFAVLLFSTVVIALLGVWGTYARAIGKARYNLVATYLGEQVMENCIAAKYANIELFKAKFPQTLNSRAKIRGTEILTTFTTSVETQDLNPNTKIVKVKVEWNEKGAVNTETRSLEYHTLLTRNA